MLNTGVGWSALGGISGARAAEGAAVRWRHVRQHDGDGPVQRPSALPARGLVDARRCERRRRRALSARSSSTSFRPCSCIAASSSSPRRSHSARQLSCASLSTDCSMTTSSSGACSCTAPGGAPAASRGCVAAPIAAASSSSATWRRRATIRAQLPTATSSARATCCSLCRTHDVDEIVVAMDDRRRRFPMDELLECRLEGMEIVELVTFLERETGKVRLDVLNPSWMIFAEGFRQGRIHGTLERAFDVVASLGAAAGGSAVHAARRRSPSSSKTGRAPRSSIARCASASTAARSSCSSSAACAKTPRATAARSGRRRTTAA